MENNKKVPDFWGECELKSNHSLENLAEIISNTLFDGAKFDGKEKAIHEEIPAIYIQKSIFGLLVILEGYQGLDNWYVLSVQPYGEFNRYISSNKIEKQRIDLDTYIYHLLKEGLKEYPEINIIKPESIS
jgi:hypothetical protein